VVAVSLKKKKKKKEKNKTRRYDQLMKFGWKFLLPLSVLNLLATAAGVLYFKV